MAKVLVIDDSSFQRKWIVKTVESLGHSTVQAGDGQEGLDLLEQENPDCITVDLTMPRMDGLEFLANLGDRSLTTPVIVITADVQDDTRRQCEELGARAFVNKPFEPSTLQEVLGELLPEGSASE
jgi:CheY-like chemotaxis protein